MNFVSIPTNWSAISASGKVESGHLSALRSTQNFSISTSMGMALPIHLMDFDIQKFSIEAFTLGEIMCPESVARSVLKRQAEFYFGRLAASWALETLNIAGVEVPIGASREPIWPAGIIGSISHTHTFAAAAVLHHGKCSGLGIDIEHVAGADACTALSTTVVGDEELRYLETLSHRLPMSTLLTAVFSAKESLFKGAFGEVGRYFDFSAARVYLIDLERGIIRLQLTEKLCDAFVCLQVCDISLYFISPDVVLTCFIW